MTGNLKRRYTLEKLSARFNIPLVQGKTLITIAHRLATIQHVDQILVVDNGRNIQIGTHL